MYKEDDMLMLSGIQHFMFCPRQWALIHIEQVWSDNRLTAEGSILHQHVDDPSYRQKNGERITLRSVHIASKELGLYGLSDAVELIPADDSSQAITHPSYPGLWTPLPVEYKRGRVKPDRRDEVQMAAQAMCLEEEYKIKLERGALFYGEMNCRVYVSIDDELRSSVKECAAEMHRIITTGMLPKAVKQSHCRNCSLFDICLPDNKKKPSVQYYLDKCLYEKTP